MVENGMTPMEAIYAATVASADLINKTESLGTIEPGKLADTIAVEQNSLDNIAAFKSVTVVIKDGVLEFQQ